MDNPYFNPQTCLARLAREYKAHKKLIVALDFDDTVYDFHKEGHRYGLVLGLIRRCQKLGFYIVLFTGSEPDRHLSQAAYLLENGIVVDSVNQNPIPMAIGNAGKPYYNILLDDRAGLGEAFSTLSLLVDRIERGVY
jgi:hypothetical protein